MFWSSITGGLGILAYWEMYAAGLMYLAFFTLPMALAGTIATRAEMAAGAVGWFSMLVLSVLQVFGLVVFVLILSPIILGLSDDAAWAFPWTLATGAPWALTKLVGLLFIAAVMLAFVPVLGQIQSLHTLLLGAFALALVIGLIDNVDPDIVAQRVHFWPGFWFVAGLLITGGIIAWIGSFGAALVGAALDPATEDFRNSVMFAISSILGFIPVFIYGAWLGMQLQGASSAV